MIIAKDFVTDTVCSYMKSQVKLIGQKPHLKKFSMDQGEIALKNNSWSVREIQCMEEGKMNWAIGVGTTKLNLRKTLWSMEKFLWK
jgi:hypothetical protein